MVMITSSIIWATTVLSMCSAVSLKSRKVTDPYMVCKGEVPTDQIQWPDGVDQNSYTSLMKLCSAANGNFENAGCVCTSHDSSLFCDTHTQTGIIATAQMSNGALVLEHCLEKCSCRMGFSYRAVAAALDETDRIHARIRHGPHYSSPAIRNTLHRQAAGRLSGLDDGARERSGGRITEYGNYPPSPAELCGGLNCSSMETCRSSTESGGCSCRAIASTYEPGSGIVTFMTACLLNSIMGKRDVQAPCPCNRTYVSEACCTAPGGLVWEPAELRLGELA